MSKIIRAYCPTGTNADAIKHMMLGVGGYTTFSGMGHWLDSECHDVAEPVVVYECVAPDTMNAETALIRAGNIFLNDNRKEQAFLGVVIGAGVKQVYIEQERK